MDAGYLLAVSLDSTATLNFVLTFPSGDQPMSPLTQPNRSSIVLAGLGAALLSLASSQPPSGTGHEKMSSPPTVPAQSSAPRTQNIPQTSAVPHATEGGSTEPAPTVQADAPVGKPTNTSGPGLPAGPATTAGERHDRSSFYNFRRRQEGAGRAEHPASKGWPDTLRAAAELLVLARELVAAQRQVLPGQLSAAELAQTRQWVYQVTRAPATTGAQSVVPVAEAVQRRVRACPILPGSRSSKAKSFHPGYRRSRFSASPQIPSKVPPSP